jgi:hypothetical protein
LSEVCHRGDDFRRPRNPEQRRRRRFRLTPCPVFSAIFASTFSRRTSTLRRCSGSWRRSFDVLRGAIRNIRIGTS